MPLRHTAQKHLIYTIHFLIENFLLILYIGFVAKSKDEILKWDFSVKKIFKYMRSIKFFICTATNHICKP